MSGITQSTKPPPGAIVTLAKSGETVLFLLDQLVRTNDDGMAIANSSVWTGWLASRYTAYACQWDIILATDIDKLMIHAWNFAAVDVGKNPEVATVLSGDDLKKVRAVFQDYLQDVPVNPPLPGTKYGQVCSRQTQTDNLFVDTGPSVISPETDLRHEFWIHYDGLAKELRTAAGAALASSQSPAEKRSSVQGNLPGLLLDLLVAPEPVLMAAAVRDRKITDSARELATLRRPDDDRYDGETHSLFEKNGKIFLRGSSLNFSALRLAGTRFKLTWEGGPEDDQRLCENLTARYVRLAAESDESVSIALEA